jgi:hypothetical protein
LREPEKSQAKGAVKILCALLSTTGASPELLQMWLDAHVYFAASVCRYTLAQAVPHLIKVLSDPAEISNRSLILSFLSDFVIAASDVSWEVPLSRNGPVFPPLSPFKDEVLGAFIGGLRVATTATTAIGGIKGMIASKNLLSYEEIGFVVHNVSEILQMDSDDFEDARCVTCTCVSLLYILIFLVLVLLLWTRCLRYPTLGRDTSRSRLCLYCSSPCPTRLPHETLALNVLSIGEPYRH